MTSFIISLTVTFILLLLFSRWKLWIGVLAGALTFGVINLGVGELLFVFWVTIKNINNWLLVIAVGLIPVLGGIIRNSIHMNAVLSNLRKNKKQYLIMTPALFGLIPIPGGALLSCPLLKGFDKNISNDNYVAINIWFRHILVIVYPLSSSLIIASQLAGLTITTAIIHMLPFSAIVFIVGYLVLLRNIKNESLTGDIKYKKNRKRDVFYIALVLLSAPILHVVLVSTLLRSREQLSFFISMTVSVILATVINKISIKKLFKIISSSKVDQFSLLFLFLLLFINTIMAYDKLDTIFVGYSPPLVFVGLLAFLLSFISGRIEIALSIVYPLLFVAFGSEVIPGILFSFIYFSLFAGYLISPLHPCMAFSLEYFETKYIQVFKKLFPLIMIPFTMIAILIWIIY